MEACELHLYVRGQSSLSAAAIHAVRRACDAHLPGRATLRVIDVHQQPERARADGVVATPTLVRAVPGPRVRLVGHLTEERLVSILAPDESAASPGVQARG